MSIATDMMQDKVLWQFKYSIAYYLTSILLLLSDALGSAYQWSNIWKLLGAKIDGSNNITPNPWMMLLLCCVFYYSVAVGHISLLSFPEAWLRYQNALFINPNTTLYAYGCVRCFLKHQHGFTQERLHTCRYQNALFLTQITTLSIILPHVSYHKSNHQLFNEVKIDKSS